jgi:hypothetical protein
MDFGESDERGDAVVLRRYLQEGLLTSAGANNIESTRVGLSTPAYSDEQH